MRAIFEWTVFPLGLVAAILGARGLLHQLDDPGMAVFAISGLAALVLLVLEWLVPERASWRPTGAELRVDLVHNVVSGGTTHLGHALVTAGLVSASAWLASVSPLALWPHDLPWAAQLALALVVAELLPYWYHRLSHRVGLLWRLHATHHCPDKLHMLNAARFHPLDLVLMHMLSVSPLIVLGCGPETLTLWSVFTAVHGLFQHSNVAHRPGPLSLVLSSADLHRWHHAVDASYANCNFGQNLIVWDWVFGSRHLPASPPDEVGLAKMPGFPTSYLEQMASPFTWRTLHKRPALNRWGLLPIERFDTTSESAQP